MRSIPYILLGYGLLAIGAIASLFTKPRPKPHWECKHCGNWERDGNRCKLCLEDA